MITTQLVWISPKEYLPAANRHIFLIYQYAKDSAIPFVKGIDEYLTDDNGGISYIDGRDIIAWAYVDIDEIIDKMA